MESEGVRRSQKESGEIILAFLRGHRVWCTVWNGFSGMWFFKTFELNIFTIILVYEWKVCLTYKVHLWYCELWLFCSKSKQMFVNLDTLALKSVDCIRPSCVQVLPMKMFKMRAIRVCKMRVPVEATNCHQDFSQFQMMWNSFAMYLLLHGKVDMINVQQQFWKKTYTCKILSGNIYIIFSI